MDATLAFPPILRGRLLALRELSGADPSHRAAAYSALARVAGEAASLAERHADRHSAEALLAIAGEGRRLAGEAFAAPSHAITAEPYP